MLTSHYYPRRIQHEIVEALQYSPVVLIQGPRQCGKTTLVTKFLNSSEIVDSLDIDPQLKAHHYITFDEPL